MTKKLEINFTKKPEIVFQFDQFLNVEQAVDKFLNKKENLKKLIAPLIPTNLEETIQKLIPEVSDGYTPQKGVDYDDGKDGETPSDEKIISLIKPQIPKVIPGKDGTTPKKGIDYFTKKELDEIKKELKTTILSEMPEHATKEEVNIKITEVLDKIRKLPTGGGGAQFLRQLMDVNVGNPTAQQYGLTYNPSRGEFALTAITGGGGAVDSVNGQTGVVVLDTSDIAEATDLNYVSDAQLTVIGNTSGTNTGDVTVSDSSEIDFTLTGQQISASIVAGSIDESKLDTSVNTSLDLADTAVQPATLSSYELLANKATDFTTINNTLYPTVQAVNTAINTAVTGLLDYRGSHDASTNLFPATGGSGILGAILSGDFWICSVAGTLGGTPVTNGDLIIAIVDTPGQTAGNWDLIENTLGYTPENVANKENTTIDTNTTKYPTVNLLKTGLDTKQATLVSGTNIKTVNSTTLLGSGDLAVATTAQGALADTALQPANISDTAYDATSWNGVTTIAPSKNAVRDKIETMDSAIALNTAKVTNATHTGEVTGSTTLTIDPTAVSNKTLKSSLAGTEEVLVNDAGTLKKTTTQDIADLGGGGVTDGDKGDITVSGSGATWTIDNSAVTLAKIENISTAHFLGRHTGGSGVVQQVSATQARSILNVEDGADVTDTANVTAAGALMDSEVDADIKTLSLPANTTITTASASVLDDTTVGAMVDTLGGATSTGTGGLVRRTSPDFTTGATIGSVAIPTISSTNTFTNKRITKRVVTAADATSITPNSDNADITYQANTQALGTLTINADGGTPTNGQSWLLKIKSTNVQTFSWNGVFVGGTNALPTATSGGSNIDYYSFIYDTVDSVWHFTGSALNF